MGRDLRVQLPYGTRCGIARIDKGFFVFGTCCNTFSLANIQSFKIVTPHIDFTANLKLSRRLWRQTQRNLANGADVVGDVLAGFTVASGGGLHQHMVKVAQADRQAIKFQLSHIFNRRIVFFELQLLANTLVESLCAKVRDIGFCVDAEHGHTVSNACEGAYRRSTYSLRG